MGIVIDDVLSKNKVLSKEKSNNLVIKGLEIISNNEITPKKEEERKSAPCVNLKFENKSGRPEDSKEIARGWIGIYEREIIKCESEKNKLIAINAGVNNNTIKNEIKTCENKIKELQHLIEENVKIINSKDNTKKID